MKKNISERIKEGLSIRNMKQSELVELTGIGKSSISTYLTGSYEPKQRNIYKIAKALDVNEAWLMGYDVDMERTISYDSISDSEKLLLNNYNLLDDLRKSKLIDYSNDLVAASRYTVPTTIAAHDDNLTDEEKDEMNRRIEEFKKNKK